VAKFVIPQKTVYRLSLYFRIVERLHQNRIETVSSAALAKAAGVKPTQLRKDLTYFGQFGTRGLGYKVESLVTQLASVLRTARFQPVILVGAGNLGSALITTMVLPKRVSRLLRRLISGLIAPKVEVRKFRCCP
jgi:redox-sensing transcriptional repressor